MQRVSKPYFYCQHHLERGYTTSHLPMSPLVSDPFSPPRPHSETPSSNPKTIANRKSIHSKAGLDIADHRADAAFRTNKCRRLQALRRHPRWAFWNDERKEAEKRKIIEELEAKRDERKRKTAIAFTLKWEQGDGDDNATDELGDERKDMLESVEKNSEKSKELINVEGNKRRKVTLKPEKVSKNNDEWDDDDWISDDSVVLELWEGKKEGAKKYFAELSKLEVKAKAANAELTEALAGVNRKEK